MFIWISAHNILTLASLANYFEDSRLPEAEPRRHIDRALHEQENT